MGADGGLVFVPLRDPAVTHEAESLLYVFPSLFSPHARFADAACKRWLKEHGQPKGALLGYYNRPACGQPQLIDLEEILNTSARLCSDPSLSLMELVLDIDTRPWLCGYGGIWHYVCENGWPEVPDLAYNINGEFAFTRLEKWLIYRILPGRQEGDEEVAERLGPLKDMVAGVWAERLRVLLDYEQIWTIETWT